MGSIIDQPVLYRLIYQRRLSLAALIEWVRNVVIQARKSGLGLTPEGFLSLYFFL